MSFGEILEPASRAFWDGLEDLDDYSPRPIEIEWEEPIREFLNCDTINLLLILEGSKIVEFAQTVHIKDRYRSCNLEGAQVTAFVDSVNKIVICLSEEDNLNLSSSIADQLVPFLRIAREVAVISVLPKTAYKGEDVYNLQDASFVKGINSKIGSIDEVKAPNFVTGACAGAASWRFIHNLSVSCYIVYIDSTDLDTLSAMPIIKLLQFFDLECDNMYYPRITDHSHLYL